MTETAEVPQTTRRLTILRKAVQLAVLAVSVLNATWIVGWFVARHESVPPAYIFQALRLTSFRPLFSKLAGNAPECPYRAAFGALYYQYRTQLDVFKEGMTASERNAGSGMTDVSIGSRTWRTRIQGDELNGRQVVASLLADHHFHRRFRQRTVRKGDIVLDCGAHIGVFTSTALDLGAGLVVAIEPDPLNSSCLARNLDREIRDGRVILYRKGVWSSRTTLALHTSTENSGANSVVFTDSGTSVDIDLVPIDDIVRELDLKRVDFIKMDIEGAEREALAGARQTLRRFRPRLMLDSYHRPDDMAAFRSVIRSAVSSYEYECATCEFHRGVLVPHVTFWW